MFPNPVCGDDELKASAVLLATCLLVLAICLNGNGHGHTLRCSPQGTIYIKQGSTFDLGSQLPLWKFFGVMMTQGASCHGRVFQ